MTDSNAMPRPPLRQAVAGARRRTPEPSAVAALATDLAAALGPERVSTVVAARRAAATDFAYLSPILSAELPGHVADLVAYPADVDSIGVALALAHRYRVPVTPRGHGTGNYGQAVPLAGGLVLDLARCDAILDIGAGTATVQAGATFVALEAAARRTGQEIALMPTTTGSTVGGFLAGGAGGVGSIEYGWIWDGFVSSLRVVPCPPSAGPLTVDGADCGPYLHAYGVTGVISAATVRLGPARERVALLASAPDWAAATAAGSALMRLAPPPRLVSVDDPGLVAMYPPDPAMPPRRTSVRAAVAKSTVEEAAAVVAAAGARVEEVRPRGVAYLTSLAFNHVTLRAKRARPRLCHLQVGGEPLVSRAREVRATLPRAVLHLDGMRDAGGRAAFGGLLLSEYAGADVLYQGIERLRGLGVVVVDPHTWLLGGPGLPAIREAAARNDPDGLLNPGKLPPVALPPVD